MGAGDRKRADEGFTIGVAPLRAFTLLIGDWLGDGVAVAAGGSGIGVGSDFESIVTSAAE